MADEPKLSLDRLLDAAFRLSQNELYRKTVETAGGNAVQALDPSQPVPPRYLYVLQGERREGPYAWGEVAERVRRGEITPDTYMWKPGMDDWRPVREMTEFAQALSGNAYVEPKEKP